MGSAKSCLGHTEGAAGVTGALLALRYLAHSAIPPVMHLRNVNSHIQISLAQWPAQRGLLPQVGRQPAPKLAVPAQVDRLGIIAGTSAFGMSGVNAHMLFGAKPAHACSPKAMRRPVLRRIRAYPLPHIHALVAAHVSPATPTSICSVTASFAPVRAAYLRENFLKGRALVPTAALVELAAATMVTFSKSALVGHICLQEVTFMRPWVLNNAACPADTNWLTKEGQCCLQISNASLDICSNGKHIFTAQMCQPWLVCKTLRSPSSARHAAWLAPTRKSHTEAVLADTLAVLCYPDTATSEGYFCHPAAAQAALALLVLVGKAWCASALLACKVLLLRSATAAANAYPSVASRATCKLSLDWGDTINRIAMANIYSGLVWDPAGLAPAPPCAQRPEHALLWQRIPINTYASVTRPLQLQTWVVISFDTVQPTQLWHDVEIGKVVNLQLKAAAAPGCAQIGSLERLQDELKNADPDHIFCVQCTHSLCSSDGMLFSYRYAQ